MTMTKSITCLSGRSEHPRPGRCPRPGEAGGRGGRGGRRRRGGQGEAKQRPRLPSAQVRVKQPQQGTGRGGGGGVRSGQP